MSVNKFFEKKGPFPLMEIIKTIGCANDFSLKKIENLIPASEIILLKTRRVAEISDRNLYFGKLRQTKVFVTKNRFYIGFISFYDIIYIMISHFEKLFHSTFLHQNHNFRIFCHIFRYEWHIRL